MTNVTRLRRTVHERVATLEERSKVHDQMAEQVKEIYDAWTTFKNVNWFLLKLAAAIGGALGFIAILLTIGVNLSHLLGH